MCSLGWVMVLKTFCELKSFLQSIYFHTPCRQKTHKISTNLEVMLPLDWRPHSSQLLSPVEVSKNVIPVDAVRNYSQWFQTLNYFSKLKLHISHTDCGEEWSQRHRTLTSILREHDIVPFYFPINLFRPSTQPHLQPFLCHALELSSTMTVLVEGFYRPF